ncbi:iron chelate uptake ABC transporter family permease subunit [Piscinibacter sakaiensis]
MQAGPPVSGSARAATVVLRDDRGAEHRFDATPRRIVSMMPSLTEMVGALGAADRLVGVDRYSNWPAAVQRLPRLGGLDDARLEAIVALQPDVVLASLSARVLDRLDALGLRAGGRLWRQLEQALAAAAQRVPPGLRGRTVYFELGGGPYAAGSSSFVGELLARLGLSNIVPPALGPFPKLNPEFIVRARPEIVMGLAREQAALAARPGWGALPALRDARRRRLATTLAALVIAGLLAGLATGADGFSPSGLVALWQDGQAGLIVGEIRLPRSLGAALVGALLGLAGALAQGLFRNPLADPYLLGSAAGAGLAVVGVLARVDRAHRPGRRGLRRRARRRRADALAGARRGAHAAPAAGRRRRRRADGCRQRPDHRGLARRAARQAGLPARLDALTLGEDSAASLGLDLGRTRLALVLMLSLATALAVSQAGLVAFVGLVAPHLVRRHAPGPHAWLLPASAAMGAVLLLGADVLSRAALAPQELPVGVVTGVLGGLYLFVLLRRRGLG